MDAWLFRLEKDFQLRGVQEEAKAVTAAFGLEGSAWSWYRSWEFTHGREPTWVEFKRELLQRYRAPDHEDKIRFQLSELKQKGDILDYIGKFQDLVAQLTFKSDPDLKNNFLRGLRAQTQSEVMYRDPETLEEAIIIASRYEASHFYVARNEPNKPMFRPQPVPQSAPQNNPARRNRPASSWKPVRGWYRPPQAQTRPTRPSPPAWKPTPPPPRRTNQTTAQSYSRFCSYCGKNDHTWFQCKLHKPKPTNLRSTQVQPNTAPRQSAVTQPRQQGN